MKKMDKKAYEPLLNVNLDPTGNNENKSLSSYYQKKLYEIKSFTHPLYSDNKPINILYEKQFYGRVDLQHISVVVDQTKLKTINISQYQQVKLLDFVSDAYREFASYWEYLKKVGKTANSGMIQNVVANTSWLDAGKMYFYYMSGIYDNLKLHIIEKNIKIKSFDQFVNEFVDYVDTVTPTIPILYSSYISSRMVDPQISGLCFDVKQLDKTSDALKYSGFLADPNYALFKKTATKFGFFPDKHIPWRLWADIDSPAMKPYMDNYGLTQDNLYDINYIKAYSYDLTLLRFYLLQFYNTWIVNQKTIVEPIVNICEKSGNTIVDYKFYNLSFINVQDVSNQKKFDHMFMKLYVFIKGREQNYSWDNARFLNIVDNFVNIKEALDFAGAMKYVVPLTKVPGGSDRLQRNFRFS